MLPFPRRLRSATAVLAAALVLPAAGTAFAWSHGHDDDFEYVLHDPRTDTRSTYMTTTGAWDRVEDLLEEATGPVFWFSIDGDGYVVDDPSTVEEAKRILVPVHELGKKQGKLGAKQGSLGAKQGELGAEQGRLGARQGALAARLAALSLRSAFRDGESAALRAERRELEAEMEELAREQRELGRRQEPLGARQRALGAQQAELGRQQASASRKAGAELRRLAERAREDGRARRD